MRISAVVVDIGVVVVFVVVGVLVTRVATVGGIFAGAEAAGRYGALADAEPGLDRRDVVTVGLLVT